MLAETLDPAYKHSLSAKRCFVVLDFDDLFLALTS